MTDVKNIIHLFQADDGSLPDIFVEGLTTKEVEDIYAWILSITSMSGDISVWNKEENKEIAIPYQDAAKAFNKLRIETFRHPIKNLSINGTVLPELTIALEFKGEISFDYRMGEDWGEEEIQALLKFLVQIKDKDPAAKIFQADECGYDEPNDEFSEFFQVYYKRSRE